MIWVFYGDDRVRAQAELYKVLGEDYEVVDGETLGVRDMPSLFLGASIFTPVRRILVRDLGENGACFGELPRYLDTPHMVVVWETKLDKRTVTYKELVRAGGALVAMREFKLAEAPEKKLVFDVFDMAYRGDGRGAVELVERIEISSDAFMFLGLMVSQVMRKLESGDRKAALVLRLLAECDMKMKSTALRPWTLIRAVLVRIGGVC